jgi:hypothetical protein
MGDQKMSIAQWQENLRVSIIGAGENKSCIKGQTTNRPPYRDGDVIKVEVFSDSGKLHQIALSRVKINGIL